MFANGQSVEAIRALPARKHHQLVAMYAEGVIGPFSALKGQVLHMQGAFKEPNVEAHFPAHMLLMGRMESDEDWWNDES